MKQRSAELSIYLHNIPSVRNKLKDVIALLEVNEISFGVCIESWTMNNWFVDFIVKRCCPPGFIFYSSTRLNKKRRWSLPLLEMWSPFWKFCLWIFGMLLCLFHCCDYHLLSNRCLSSTWIKIFHWSLYYSFWKKATIRQDGSPGWF